MEFLKPWLMPVPDRQWSIRAITYKPQSLLSFSHPFLPLHHPVLDAPAFQA